MTGVADSGVPAGKREMSENGEPVIAAYESRPAVCQKYDDRAAAVARLVAALVCKQLPEVCVEHVGSTAVPRCAGTGIVDLMIPVSEGEIEKVESVLDQLGFQRQSGRVAFPEDCPMRVGACDFDGRTFPLHIHIIPSSTPEAEEMRFFRACLRADPKLLKLYVARKRAVIADGVTDPLDYSVAMGEFIRAVLG